MELLQDFPGEAILWLVILAIGIVWGRYKEREKYRKGSPHAKNRYK